METPLDGKESNVGMSDSNAGLCVTFDEVRRMTIGALVDADQLAHCAERMLGALNEVAGAQAMVDAVDTAAAYGRLQAAEELRSEYWRAIQSAAYEYRKRAARLRAALTHNEQS